MSPVVLLVATATRWVGAARIAEGLAKAGFVPVVLAPRGSLLERSRFVRKIGHLPEAATPHDWVFSLAAMVKATSPRLAFPCDDLSARLMFALAESPPPELLPETHLRLAMLVRDSLGDPAHYAASVDKTRFPAAAAALGLRVPASEPVADFPAAASFAGAHGYPVVVKRAHGAAGEGVVVAPDREALAVAVARLSAPAPGDPMSAGASRLLVQAHVEGRVVSRSSVAWTGRELAGVTREKVVRNPAGGPGTVMRYYCDPEVRRSSQALARGFRLSGFFGVEYVLAEGTGEAVVLEVNRRVTPGSHTGAQVGVDLCAALHAAVSGIESRVPEDVAPGFERTVARFPQEWLRDPGSPWLREHPVDAPWDDPELFEAYLALRHDP